MRRWVIFSVISIKLPCILPTFENFIRVGYNISPPRSNADNQHLPESLLTWMSFWVILHFWAPIWGGNSWTFPIPSLRPTSFEKGQTLEVWSDSKQAGQAKEMAPTPRCEWCDWMWLEYTYIYIYIHIHISVSICIYLRIYIYTVAYACFLLRNMNGSRPLRAPFQGSLFRHWMRWNMMEHTKKRCLPSSGFHVNITRNSDVSLCLNFFEGWIEPSNVSNHRPIPAVNL